LECAECPRGHYDSSRGAKWLGWSCRGRAFVGENIGRWRATPFEPQNGGRRELVEKDIVSPTFFCDGATRPVDECCTRCRVLADITQISIVDTTTTAIATTTSNTNTDTIRTTTTTIKPGTHSNLIYTATNKINTPTATTTSTTKTDPDKRAFKRASTALMILRRCGEDSAHSTYTVDGPALLYSSLRFQFGDIIEHDGYFTSEGIGLAKYTGMHVKWWNSHLESHTPPFKLPCLHYGQRRPHVRLQPVGISSSPFVIPLPSPRLLRHPTFPSFPASLELCGSWQNEFAVCPAGIGQLTSLTSLSFGKYCNWTELHEELKDLTSLLQFGADSLSLTEFPPVLQYLTTLRVLSLSMAGSLGHIPTTLCLLEELQDLGQITHTHTH
jgi:hypothetical protein